MSRIVAWVHGLYPHQRAGSETMLDDMLAALAADGHEVHAVATMSGPADGSVTWERRGYHCWRVDPAMAFVRDVEPDIVLSHHHHGPEAIATAKACDAASAVILHNDFRWSREMINARPDLVVYNAHWLRRKLSPRGAAAVVVHPPLTAAAHALEPDRGPGDAVTIINLDRIKGPDVFWALAARFPATPFLAVRGAYGRQDERSGHANVTVIDTTTDMRSDVWERTRVLIVPSRYESYGRGAVEACAAGIPVVASPTAGLRESLGPAGTFANRGDHAAWARHVGRYLTDAASWERASRAALARAADLDAMRRVELDQWTAAVQELARRVAARRARRLPVPTATAT